MMHHWSKRVMRNAKVISNWRIKIAIVIVIKMMPLRLNDQETVFFI